VTAVLTVLLLVKVCEHRFGYSMLGRIIRQGIDPHSFTAAQYLGLPLARFLELEKVSCLPSSGCAFLARFG